MDIIDELRLIGTNCHRMRIVNIETCSRSTFNKYNLFTCNLYAWYFWVMFVSMSLYSIFIVVYCVYVDFTNGRE